MRDSVAANPSHTVAFLGTDRVQTIAWVANGRMVHHIGLKPPALHLASSDGLHIEAETAVFNSTQALAEAYLRDKQDVHRVAEKLADFLGAGDYLSSPRRGVVTATAQPALDQPRRLVTEIATTSPAPSETEGLTLAAQLLSQQAERNRQLAAEQNRRRELSRTQAATLTHQRQIEFARRLERAEDQRRQDSDRLMAFAAREQAALSASLQKGVEQMQKIEAQSAHEWHERLKQPMPHERFMEAAQRQQRGQPVVTVPKGGKSSGASGRASVPAMKTAANASLPAFQHVNAVVKSASKASGLDCSPKRIGSEIAQLWDDRFLAPVGSCCGWTRDCSGLPPSCGETMTQQNRACLQHDTDLRQCGLPFYRLDSACVTAAHRALCEHSTALRIRVPSCAAAHFGEMIQEQALTRRWEILPPKALPIVPNRR